jgi:hypothetical protein
MRLSRLQRRLTALTTALLLSLCQLAFAAQACAHALATQDRTPVMPCHETDGTPATPNPATVCDAPTTVGADISFPVLDVTDLPALPAAPITTDAVEPLSPYRPVAVAVYRPPPFTVLNCRFLN